MSEPESEHDRQFSAALQRPVDYPWLPPATQWAIDKMLDILDWEGPQNDEEWNRLRRHHGLAKENEPWHQLQLC